MNELLLTTVITDPQSSGFRTYLEPSARKHGHRFLPIIVLEHTGPWQHTTKIRLMIEFLKKESPHTLVMFVDGYDSIILADPREIVKKFKAFDTTLLISGEKNCSPDESLAGGFSSNGTAPFLNSGGYMGYAYRVIEALCEVGQQPTPSRYAYSDQRRWMEYYLQHPRGIVIDTESQIFYDASTRREDREKSKYYFSGANWEEDMKKVYQNRAFLDEELGRVQGEICIHESRIVHKGTGARPCVVHVSGQLCASLEVHRPFWGQLCG